MPLAIPYFVMIALMLARLSQLVGKTPVSSIYAEMIACSEEIVDLASIASVLHSCDM